MRYAIFSDLHDNAAALTLVERDAQRLAADSLVFLGDLGNDPDLFHTLRERGIPAIYGNWEVSGLRRLPDELAVWVGAWPSTRNVGDDNGGRNRNHSVVLCHATPDMPDAVATTKQAVTYMRQQKTGWLDLFPRLHRNDEARWRGLAALEAGGHIAAFHGHTHVQEVWSWRVELPPSSVSANGDSTSPASTETHRRRLRLWPALEEFRLDPGRTGAPSRYLIGVGSAGDPQDGRAAKYVLYDSVSGVVTLRSLPA